jgi:hypothetical protein
MASAGLSLRTGISAGYAPMTPPSANSYTAGGVLGSGSTISQMAYGISGSGNSTVGNLPGYGAVGAGLAAVALLVFMWWSLPR